MRIKFLNTEHGIGSCNTEDVPAWVTKHGPAAEVAFFYCHQRDWIVLNEDNPNFELYKMVIENYEDFSDMAKKEFAEKCKSDFPKVAEALKALDYVNRIRRNLYRHMKERAA